MFYVSPQRNLQLANLFGERSFGACDSLTSRGWRRPLVPWCQFWMISDTNRNGQTWGLWDPASTKKILPCIVWKMLSSFFLVYFNQRHLLTVCLSQKECNRKIRNATDKTSITEKILASVNEREWMAVMNSNKLIDIVKQEGTVETGKRWMGACLLTLSQGALVDLTKELCFLSLSCRERTMNLTVMRDTVSKSSARWI